MTRDAREFDSGGRRIPTTALLAELTAECEALEDANARLTAQVEKARAMLRFTQLYVPDKIAEDILAFLTDLTPSSRRAQHEPGDHPCQSAAT